MQQNSLKEHYAQAEAIVAERQAEMNSNLARIANEKALRDANDLIQKQRKDILDYQEAMTRMDTLENVVMMLAEWAPSNVKETITSMLVSGKEVSFDNQ
jgi:hypothetical protein